MTTGSIVPLTLVDKENLRKIKDHAKTYIVMQEMTGYSNRTIARWMTGNADNWRNSVKQKIAQVAKKLEPRTKSLGAVLKEAKAKSLGTRTKSLGTRTKSLGARTKSLGVVLKDPLWLIWRDVCDLSKALHGTEQHGKAIDILYQISLHLRDQNE
jgi:hypothetical protein